MRITMRISTRKCKALVFAAALLIAALGIIDGLGSAGIKLYRYRSMGIDLVQTSYSTIPSVDVEVGDRASDHSASTVKKIANGIAAGITDFFR